MNTPNRPEVDIDTTARSPLRLGIDTGEQVWLNTSVALARVRAPELRRLARNVAVARREQPDCDVVADIQVVIAGTADEARTALAASARQPDPGALLYVGTVTGVVGLIVDLYSLGITDGAVLIPVVDGAVIDLIRNEVLPELATFLPIAVGDQEQPG